MKETDVNGEQKGTREKQKSMHEWGDRRSQRATLTHTVKQRHQKKDELTLKSLGAGQKTMVQVVTIHNVVQLQVAPDHNEATMDNKKTKPAVNARIR